MATARVLIEYLRAVTSVPELCTLLVPSWLFCRRRRQDAADVPVYKKVNSHLLHPATGQRVRHGQRRAAVAQGRPKTLSFGAAAITAFVGFRVCQLLVRCFRRRKLSPEEEEELLIQQALERQQLQQLPPVVSAPSVGRVDSLEEVSVGVSAGQCRYSSLAAAVQSYLSVEWFMPASEQAIQRVMILHRVLSHPCLGLCRFHWHSAALWYILGLSMVDCPDAGTFSA